MAGDVIKKKLIRSAGRGELPVGGQGGRVDRVETGRERLPANGGVRRATARLRALLDPELQQSQFFRRHRPNAHVVVGGRHDRLFLVRGQLQQQARVRVSGHDRGS